MLSRKTARDVDGSRSAIILLMQKHHYKYYSIVEYDLNARCFDIQSSERTVLVGPSQFGPRCGAGIGCEVTWKADAASLKRELIFGGIES